MKDPTPISNQYRGNIGNWSGENESAIEINSDVRGSLDISKRNDN